MSTLLKDKNGQTSSVRVAYFIKLAVGVGALVYAIYSKYFPMELAIVISGLFGINAVEKLVSKKLEK